MEMEQNTKKMNWWQSALTASIWFDVIILIFALPGYGCVLAKDSVFLRILGVVLLLIAIVLFFVFMKNVGEDDEEPMSVKQKIGARTIFIGVSVVLTIVCVMVMGMFGIKPYNVKDNSFDELNQYDVWAIAEEKVEEKLKDPSSAVFCSMSQGSISQDGDVWTVTGYVDAKNSFNATIRNSFKVVITATGGRYYTVDSVLIY